MKIFIESTLEADWLTTRAKKVLTKNVHRVEHCSHPGEKVCYLAVLHKMIFTRTKSNRAQELSKAQTVLFCEGGKALHGRAKLRSFTLKKMCGRGDSYFLQYKHLKPNIRFLQFFSPLLGAVHLVRTQDFGLF